MTVTTQTKTSAETSTEDRRRPGRQQVNPALIPILRVGEPAVDATYQDIEFDEPDQVAGARGVFFGVAIAVPLWVSIACLGRWLLT